MDEAEEDERRVMRMVQDGSNEIFDWSVEYNEKGKIVNKEDLGLVLLGKKNCIDDIFVFSKEIGFSYFTFEEIQDDESVLVYGKKKKIAFCPMCMKKI